MPGYRTCLLSRPQSAPADRVVASGGTSGRARPSVASWAGEASGRRARIHACLSVGDQGTSGWCTAFALVGSLQALACDAGLADFLPSVAHLWYAGHGARPFTATDLTGGWHLAPAAEALRAATLVPEARWAFFGDPDPAANAANMNQEREDLDLRCDARFGTDALGGSATGVQALRQALDRGEFPVVGVPVYRDGGWDAPDTSALVVDAPPARPPGDCPCSCQGREAGCAACPEHASCLVGYHAIVLVDHDPRAGLFEFANSWGTAWGEGGYAAITDRLLALAGPSAQPANAARRAAPAGCAPRQVEADAPPGTVEAPMGTVTGAVHARLAGGTVTAREVRDGAAIEIVGGASAISKEGVVDGGESLVFRFEVEALHRGVYDRASARSLTVHFMDLVGTRLFYAGSLDGRELGAAQLHVTELIGGGGTFRLTGTLRAHLEEQTPSAGAPGVLDVELTF